MRYIYNCIEPFINSLLAQLQLPWHLNWLVMLRVLNNMLLLGRMVIEETTMIVIILFLHREGYSTGLQ